MTAKDIERLIISEIKRFGGTIPKRTKFNWERIITDFAKQQMQKAGRITLVKRKINEKERAKGRSENYYSLSPDAQWDEDKRLGILDWDGK